jgi:hypothetical protein
LRNPPHHLKGLLRESNAKEVVEFICRFFTDLPGKVIERLFAKFFPSLPGRRLMQPFAQWCFEWPLGCERPLTARTVVEMVRQLQRNLPDVKASQVIQIIRANQTALNLGAVDACRVVEGFRKLFPLGVPWKSAR